MARLFMVLVEDDPDDKALTLRALKMNGVDNEVVVLSDGAEALDYMLPKSKNGEQELVAMPAVVLLDLKLPKINGLEVLEQLRKNSHTKNVPVVVFTSSEEEQDVKSSYELGANSYIRKPVDFDEFSKAIGDLGEYWLCLNEPPVSEECRS